MLSRFYENENKKVSAKLCMGEPGFATIPVPQEFGPMNRKAGKCAKDANRKINSDFPVRATRSTCCKAVLTNASE